MTTAYLEMGDQEKTLIDAIIFVRECLIRQYCADDKAKYPSYAKALDIRILSEREIEAKKFLHMRRTLDDSAYQTYLESRECEIHNANSILRFGLTYRSISEKTDTDSWRTIARGGNADVSVLVALLEHLPRDTVKEQADTLLQTVRGSVGKGR